jgi:Zn-dependent oligopeptidase
MSGHYKDGSELPKEMLDKLIQSKKANAGIFNLRQVRNLYIDNKLFRDVYYIFMFLCATKNSCVRIQKMDKLNI